jgi:Domain of unknown function (DUF4440)
MSNPLPESPNAAVQAWWQAMQNQDLAALQQLTAEDYLASGGPAGRTTTRDQLLAEAKTFFGETTRIDTWSVEAMSYLDWGPSPSARTTGPSAVSTSASPSSWQAPLPMSSFVEVPAGCIKPIT